MEITKELALAMLAGARGIRSNRRCCGARYVLDPTGKNLEVSYYDAANELIKAAAEVLELELSGQED